jgi:hypothetical protein
MTKKWLPALSLLSLAACLAAPVMHFLGKISADSYRVVFLAASVGWFIFATLWTRRK